MHPNSSCGSFVNLPHLVHPPVGVDPEHVEQLLSPLREALLVLLHHVAHGDVGLEGNSVTCGRKKKKAEQRIISAKR